jgi:hypothetical protein
MIGSLESPFPLTGVTDAELQQLSQTLWNWDICNGCQNGQTCVAPSCSWKRSARLGRFFDFYKEATSFYVPELLPGSKPALRNHGDVLEIIRLIRSQPNTSRSELTRAYFSQRDTPPPPADQHRAFNLAIKIMSMVTCSAENQPSGLLELGTQPLPWHSDSSAVEFMSRAFPAVGTGDLRVRDDSGRIRDVKSALSARRLKKIAGLRFQGTDDLRNHLRLDGKQGAVEIYHYTSVLKESLMASQSARDSATAGEYISA